MRSPAPCSGMPPVPCRDWLVRAGQRDNRDPAAVAERPSGGMRRTPRPSRARASFAARGWSRRPVPVQARFRLSASGGRRGTGAEPLPGGGGRAPAWSSPSSAAPATGGTSSTRATAPGAACRELAADLAEQQRVAGLKYAAAEHDRDAGGAMPRRRIAATAIRRISAACLLHQGPGHRVAARGHREQHRAERDQVVLAESRPCAWRRPRRVPRPGRSARPPRRPARSPGRGRPSRAWRATSPRGRARCRRPSRRSACRARGTGPSRRPAPRPRS